MNLRVDISSMKNIYLLCHINTCNQLYEQMVKWSYRLENLQTFHIFIQNPMEQCSSNSFNNVNSPYGSDVVLIKSWFFKTLRKLDFNLTGLLKYIQTVVARSRL